MTNLIDFRSPRGLGRAFGGGTRTRLERLERRKREEENRKQERQRESERAVLFVAQGADVTPHRGFSATRSSPFRAIVFNNNNPPPPPPAAPAPAPRREGGPQIKSNSFMTKRPADNAPRGVVRVVPRAMECGKGSVLSLARLSRAH
jgi:hypothetical protein